MIEPAYFLLYFHEKKRIGRVEKRFQFQFVEKIRNINNSSVEVLVSINLIIYYRVTIRSRPAVYIRSATGTASGTNAK